MSLVALVLPCSATGQVPGEEVIARVEGTTITYAQFSKTYVRHLIATGANDTRQARYAHLETLIDDVLLAAEARRRGMEDAAYEAFVDRKVKQAVGDRYFSKAFADSVPAPSDAELREAFRRSKEQRSLRHLFYRSEAEAQTAHRRLEAGADFVRLANESLKTAAFDSSAGSLGVVEYWDLDDAIAEAAYALPVGGYSDPVRSRYGWHILKVEDRLLNPILTESEYQYRREGIANEVRFRRLRLGGDRFVRSFMSGLDVRTNAAGIADLRNAVRQALGEEPEPEVFGLITAEEVRAVRDGLTPETALATFMLDGERYTFTVKEYTAWLEELPYKEIRARTAASVGRALRNEALAAKGLSLGLQEDPAVLEAVRFSTTLYLSDALREHLRTAGAVVPTEEELRLGYEKLGYASRPEQVRATYWSVPFASFEAAERARATVLNEAGGEQALAGYERHVGQDLAEAGVLARELAQLPLGEPVVVGTADGGWHLLAVGERAVRYTTFEEARADLAHALTTYGAELKLLRDLRSRADVEVNAELFERSMERAAKR